jgi:hypothetical protein
MDMVEHSMCRAPRAVPGGFAGFGRFPESEVPRPALAVGFRAEAGSVLLLVERAAGELAVALELIHLEVDVALGLVGEALVHQALDDL